MARFDEDDLIQLSFLRDEETDALIAIGLLSDDLRLSSPLDNEVAFTYDEMTLKVLADPHYPASTITFSIENGSLPREFVDELRKQVRDIVAAADRTNNPKNWIMREESEFGIFEPVKVVMQVAQHVTKRLRDHRTQQFHGGKAGGSSEDGPDKHLWFLEGDIKKAVDIRSTVTSTSELAFRLLGVSAREIASDLNQMVRVLHVEQVLRHDHARNLDLFQGRLRQTLSHMRTEDLRAFVPHGRRTPRRADLIDHIVKTRISYHGTLRQHVPGIVRHGFVAPGRIDPATADVKSLRCGSTYGMGVYTSPSAEFSLLYSGQQAHRTTTDEFFGLKLIVCATVLGRCRRMYRHDAWQQEVGAWEGFDSHVGNEDLEYITFDGAQTIPVYVVHFDWGEKNAELFSNSPANPAEWARQSSSIEGRLSRWEKKEAARAMAPGDKQREKEAIRAKAAKYFPYGFGPATGSKFVVEEVGEVSEDEEEYGDYQDLLISEREDHVTNTDFWSWMKASEVEQDKLKEGMHDADEYNRERHALRVPEGFRKKATAWDDLDMPGVQRDGPLREDSFGLSELMSELPDHRS